MSLLRNLAGGLRGLFRKQQVEREMDEELRGYLDAAVNEKMRRGLNREQAVRAARIEMGGAESVKQRVRAASWESLVETLWQDLKFGLRLLRFSPAFDLPALGCDSSKSAPGKKRSGTDRGAHRGTQRCNRCLRVALSQSDKPHVEPDSSAAAGALGRIRLGTNELQYLSRRPSPPRPGPLGER